MTISDRVARIWWHTTRPEGLPRDWIDTYAEIGEVQQLHMAASAALLSVASRLHVDAHGVACAMKDCVLCRSL